MSPNDEADRDLVQRAKANDRSAFDELWTRDGTTLCCMPVESSCPSANGLFEGLREFFHIPKAILGLTGEGLVDRLRQCIGNLGAVLLNRRRLALEDRNVPCHLGAGILEEIFFGE